MAQSEENAIGGICQLIQIKPVGVVRNRSQNLNRSASFNTMSWQERAAKMKMQSQTVSELVINADLDGILDGIDDFSHLIVLYWAHLVPDERRSLIRVHPMGSSDFPLVGVFATHSPTRPNSILTSVVKLLGREGNTLKVTGLDALDGSPILDIKPYDGELDKLKDVKMPNWMRRIHQEFGEDAS
jgi:tRNA-Thr(GGU) m(6)t(6)A37 methyltransferase TsaA